MLLAEAAQAYICGAEQPGHPPHRKCGLPAVTGSGTMMNTHANSTLAKARTHDGTGMAILSAAAGGLLRAWEQQQTATELSRLDDHILDDIGLRREEIGTVARQIGGANGPEAPRHSRLRRAFEAMRTAWLRRAMIRDLERLPDEILEDIGIPRWRIEEAVDTMLAETAKKRAQAQAAGETPTPATVSAHSPVHGLIARLEQAVRPLLRRQGERPAGGRPTSAASGAQAKPAARPQHADKRASAA
ncbi:MAG: DUF1127 domain-containing protein [Alphaproteobacteria bacterium]|nr:MAG: DUF1127 domain-containing protein [Alphaproteobacteria bacterium]